MLEKHDNIISSGFFLIILVFLSGCLKGPLRYPAGDYVVVETTQGDTLSSLAEKYLDDPEKAWMIAEFNKTKIIEPGSQVIIPLKPFNLGGLKPDGYQVVPVLCYSIVEEEGLTGPITGLTGFERQMEYLKKNNFQVISLERFMEFLNYRDQIPVRSVVITIDDNSRAVMSLALHVLKRYHFPATLFVDPAMIGSKSCLTYEDLRLLKASGLDIQCRAGWNLDSDIENKRISLKEYFKSMKVSLEFARKTLGPVSESACEYYALPLTGGNNLLIELLRKEGFQGALTLNDQPNPFYVDHYDVGRISVSPGLSLDKFEEKLSVFRWVKMD